MNSFANRRRLLQSLRTIRENEAESIERLKDEGPLPKLTARERLELVCDRYELIDLPVHFSDPLASPGYREKFEAHQAKTGMAEAILVARAELGETKAVVFAMDSRFLMASMGAYVGSAIAHAFAVATAEGLPVLAFSCSGGARMQEGIISLMQMAKTSIAVKRHGAAGLFFLSVLTDPTTGGVTASFASLGDIIVAEPGALIGFAGPRVIRETVRQELPEGFQRAEYLLAKGMIDAIVPREEMKKELTALLALHTDVRGEAFSCK